MRPPASEVASSVATDIRRAARFCADMGLTLAEAVSLFEADFLEVVLVRNNSNQSKTAQLLGVHRNTLNRRVKELGVELPARQHYPPVRPAPSFAPRFPQL